MSIKRFYPISRLLLGMVLAISLFSCVKDQNYQSYEEVEMYRLSDLDLVQPVAMDAIETAAAEMSYALSSTIDKAGVKEAIEYCNLSANDLIKTIAEDYGVEIKRTSLKLRNHSNKPSKDEKLILDFYAKQESLGKACKGEMSKVDGIYKYYHPIYVSENCTQCHGIAGESLHKKAAKKLAELYLNDNAQDYHTGDLRGMWVVTFTK
tara:strand:+ start:2242 stop:2862 length:621 start_codon:yes stop_codon:yes gene_type:complete